MSYGFVRKRRSVPENVNITPAISIMPQVLHVIISVKAMLALEELSASPTKRKSTITTAVSNAPIMGLCSVHPVVFFIQTITRRKP